MAHEGGQFDELLCCKYHAPRLIIEMLLSAVKNIRLERWDEFAAALEKLEAKRVTSFERRPGPSSGFLFRGHGHSRWMLKTTLDRFFSKRVTLLEYYRHAQMARTKIETFTGKQWLIPTVTEYQTWLNTREGRFFPEFMGYEYLAYLRHPGVPSPLLDWSKTP